MSRVATRARRRRAHLESLRLEFQKSRDDPAAFSALLTRIAASAHPLWPIAQSAAGDRPLDEVEKAMIVAAVAPHLAGAAQGNVRRREARGREAKTAK
jgi:hypothetical protein